jgi:hypothetical protein
MKTALYLMLDCRKPHMRFFWRRHGLKIMERLTPSGLSFLTPHMMLEQELRKALHGSGNRLIIIGSPELLSQTFHLLMKEFESGQPPCEIGFWEITKKEAWFSMLQTSETFSPLLHTFRNGHAVPVNVIKVRYTDRNAQLETAYFWNEIVVQASGHPSSSIVSIGGEEWPHQSKVRYRLALHQEPLHSWRINHSNLLKANYLQVYAANLSSSADGVAKLQQPLPRESWLGKGEFVQLHGNYLQMSAPHGGWTADTQQLQVEVLPRSLYLLIPMIPAKSAERSRANLLAFKPRSLLVASRQQSSQNVVKNSGDSMDTLLCDDNNQ